MERMNKFRFSLVLLVMAVILAGCGNGTPPGGNDDDGDGTPTNPLQGHNNYALLSGPAIGTGEYNADGLYYKTVPVQVVNGDEHLQVDTVAHLWSGNTTACDVIIKVKNISNEPVYYVQAGVSLYYGAPFYMYDDLTPIGTIDVHGSVGLISSDYGDYYYYNSLAPGEEGYITTGRLVVHYDYVEHVKVGVSCNDWQVQDPGIAVIPQSYQVAGDGTVSITIKNTGSTEVEFDQYGAGYGILFDGDRPVFTNYFPLTELSKTSLSGGEECIITHKFGYRDGDYFGPFTGTAGKILVILNVKPKIDG